MWYSSSDLIESPEVPKLPDLHHLTRSIANQYRAQEMSFLDRHIDRLENSCLMRFLSGFALLDGNVAKTRNCNHPLPASYDFHVSGRYCIYA